MSDFTIENGVFIATDETIHEAIYYYLDGNEYNLPPIGTWNTSKVTNMNEIFGDCDTFNENINNWDVSNVTNMCSMFADASSFNQPLNNWNVSNVTNMASMFYNASAFNQPLNNWDVSKVSNLHYMFEKAIQFNQPLNNWKINSNVVTLENMFCESNFNQSLNEWDVSNVKKFHNMFEKNISFNQPLNNWNVSNAVSLNNMFNGARSFNQSLNNWNVSNVTDFSKMFRDARSFNQPLNKWQLKKRDINNVEHDNRSEIDMENMFSFSGFNQPLNDWDVSAVYTFEKMFYSATFFNQPLNRWNVALATNLTDMFKNASSFRQNISNWQINPSINIEDHMDMFRNTIMPRSFVPPVFRQFITDNRIANPNEGIAYQVHNAFNVIQFQKLFELISNKIDNYSKAQSFNYFMISELQTILSSYTEEDKTELTERFNRLTPKIESIDYNTDFKMNPNPSGINAFFTIINFVKKQEKHYQDNYIKFFINDSYNAYNSGSDNISCVKGIKERLIFALGQAGYDIENPLYKQISEILFPLKDEQLYAFISNCIREKKSELLSIGDSNMDGKKEELLKCVSSKIKESFPNMDAEGLKTRILGLIENSIDMFENESLKGGKKRKKRFTKKRRRETKKIHRKTNKSLKGSTFKRKRK
jgi:surface protein